MSFINEKSKSKLISLSKLGPLTTEDLCFNLLITARRSRRRSISLVHKINTNAIIRSVNHHGNNYVTIAITFFRAKLLSLRLYNFCL